MTLQGALTFATVPALAARAGELLGDGRVDLAQVGNADSSGLALLLELARQAQRQGKTLQLLNVPAQLQSLIRFFELEPTLGMAMEAA